MASIIERLTRNFNISMKSPSAVRRMIHNDELTENMEYMLSRGKEDKIKRHNRKARTEGEKIHIAPIPEWKGK